MTTAVPILERGLTAVALNDYIKSEPRIAELDGTLAAGVDGDLLMQEFSRARTIRKAIIDAGQDSGAVNFGRNQNGAKEDG